MVVLVVVVAGVLRVAPSFTLAADVFQRRCLAFWEVGPHVKILKSGQSCSLPVTTLCGVPDFCSLTCPLKTQQRKSSPPPPPR